MSDLLLGGLLQGHHIVLVVDEHIYSIELGQLAELLRKEIASREEREKKLKQTLIVKAL